MQFLRYFSERGKTASDGRQNGSEAGRRRHGCITGLASHTHIPAGDGYHLGNILPSCPGILHGKRLEMAGKWTILQRFWLSSVFVCGRCGVHEFKCTMRYMGKHNRPHWPVQTLCSEMKGGREECREGLIWPFICGGRLAAGAGPPKKKGFSPLFYQWRT